MPQSGVRELRDPAGCDPQLEAGRRREPNARSWPHPPAGRGATAGQPQDFVSAGLAPGYRADMVAWADGTRLFEYLLNLPEPSSVADLPAYVREFGFPPPG